MTEFNGGCVQDSDIDKLQRMRCDDTLITPQCYEGWGETSLVCGHDALVDNAKHQPDRTMKNFYAP